MEYAGYEFINEGTASVRVKLGKLSTPVFIQQRWSAVDHPNSGFVVRNGCGHCCAAMAVTMYSHPIDPLEEYNLCRELWGAPNEVVTTSGKTGEGNFQSAMGIMKIIRHFGIGAECYGVPSLDLAKVNIEKALSLGKQVIFCVRPTSEERPHPFSRGWHWVMAVGYTEQGKILVANSSEPHTEAGVQETDIDTVLDALCLGSAPEDLCWGVWSEDFKAGTGYIIVG